jgi:exosortase
MESARSIDNDQRLSPLEEFLRDFPRVWRGIPQKGLFAACLALWAALFQFLGNSTFGYINTHSLFAWTRYSYSSGEDDAHGFLIPFLVLGLLWWKRKELATVSTKPWPPGLVIIAAAVALHIIGYLSQQTRLSLAAFFFGLYGLIGAVWGFEALKKTFFPMCLFAFALPLGTLAETITFPLRLLATKLTSGIAGTALGISVIQQGTLIYDPSGAFKYEVAAACGGLRSLTAVMALCTICAFINFKKTRNILLMIAAGFPLAVLGNVSRLLMIIIVSEAFGQKYGQWVHDNSFFSLLPYVPPIIGILLLSHLLDEKKKAGNRPSSPLMDPKAQVPATT